MKKCSNKDSLKMILLWVTLLLSHQGYALVPVTTVHLGETVTFRCDLPEIKDRNGKLYWYKQTAGNTLEIVAKFVNHANPDYGPGFSDTRVKTVLTDKMSNLTILKTVQQDEGMYHCAFTDWTRNVWHGNYLLIKGNAVGTSNQRVFQRLMVSDSLRPEDDVTLQCSVLSDFENKTCSRDLSVFWFRSDKSHPHIFLTDGNRPDKCQKKIDHQNRCVYNFSKNISSSAAGTHYCAVATCGEILFGNGTKFEAEPTADPVLVIVVSCLVISLIMNIVFFCYRNPRAACKQFKEGTYSQDRRRDLSQQGDDTNEDERDLNYAALRFSAGKATRQKHRNETGDSVYSHIKL